MEIYIAGELWPGLLDCKSVYHDKFVLFVDSQSSTHLDKNPNFHNRSKHIDVWFHWIQDVLDAKLLELVNFHIDD